LNCVDPSPEPGLCGAQAAELELKRLSNRTRFILAVVAGQLQISGRKKAGVEEQLEQEGYDRMAPNRRKVMRRSCVWQSRPNLAEPVARIEG